MVQVHKLQLKKRGTGLSLGSTDLDIGGFSMSVTRYIFGKSLTVCSLVCTVVKLK